MVSILLSVFLLVGSPLQSKDSVLVAKETLHDLETRLENVESSVGEFSAREDYFESILSEQRQNYVTIILGLLGILGVFGYVSIIVERRRLEKYVDDKIKGMKNNLKSVEDRLDGIKKDAIEASASAYKLFAIRNRSEGVHWAALRDTVDAINQISKHDNIDSTKREVISDDINKAILDIENIKMSGSRVLKDFKEDLVDKIQDIMNTFGGDLRKEVIELYREVENLEVIEPEERVANDV